MLTRLGYYLNVSMINYNRKRNTGSKDTSEKLLEMKLHASHRIIPILDVVFEALFGRVVIDDERTLNLLVNLEQ